MPNFMRIGEKQIWHRCLPLGVDVQDTFFDSGRKCVAMVTAYYTVKKYCGAGVLITFSDISSCDGYEIVESTLRLVLSESQKLNLAKHCVLPIVQSRWGMKTMGYSLLRNTNELQDFISDLHSHPVVLNIP